MAYMSPFGCLLLWKGCDDFTTTCLSLESYKIFVGLQQGGVSLKPIVHKAFFCLVGADNATEFALGTFQIFCSAPKIYFLTGAAIIINQDPK